MLHDSWTLIAQIICVAVYVSLPAVAYDLDQKTSPVIRGLLVFIAAVFFLVFWTTFKHPELLEHAMAIAFTGFGVLALVFVLYMALKKQIQPFALKVSGLAFGISLLVWMIGSCSDRTRQTKQIQQVSRDSLRSEPTDQEQADLRRRQDLLNP